MTHPFGQDHASETTPQRQGDPTTQTDGTAQSDGTAQTDQVELTETIQPLPSMLDLDQLEADLNSIDETLAELDADRTAEPSVAS